MFRALNGGLEKIFAAIMFVLFSACFINIFSNSFGHYRLQPSSDNTESTETSPSSDEADPVINQKNTFNHAMNFLLKHEGGLSNVKFDRGGITKYGISIVYLKDLLAKDPQLRSELSLGSPNVSKTTIIKNLTKQQATNIYYLQWWKKYHIGKIKKSSIAIKAFDFSINMGANRAIKLLQTACRQVANSPVVTVNGKIDRATTRYINSLNKDQTHQLLMAYDAVAAQYYVGLVKTRPTNKKFLVGWLRRANSNPNLTA